MLHANQGETQYDETGRISLPGCTTAGRLPVQDGDDSGGTAGASLQFVHEVVDQEPSGREEVGVGHVLQAPDIGPAQDLVGLEDFGLAPVSAGSVHTKSGDVPPVHQPPGCRWRHSWEVKMLRVVLRQRQVSGSSEVFLCVPVMFPPAGVEDDDGVIWDVPVLQLPALDVGDGKLGVGVCLCSLLDADLDGGPGESLQGDVSSVPPVLVEVGRGVRVSPEVFCLQ